MANNNWTSAAMTDGMVSELSDTQIAAFPSLLDQYASQTLKTASGFMRIYMLMAEKIERTDINKNVMARRTQKNMSSLLVSATARGKDNKFEWASRYAHQFAIGVTNATISGTPGATSTYTLTDPTAYDASGKLSNVFLEYDYKIPTGSTTGMPYMVGRITNVDKTTDFAHVLTVKPVISTQTLPSVTAGDKFIQHTLVSTTGGSPTYNTQQSSYYKDFNYFQTMLPATKYTDDTADYMARFAVDTDLYKGIVTDLYKNTPGGVPPGLSFDGQRQVSQSVLNYAINVMVSMNSALLYGVKNHESVTTADGVQRRDSMGGLFEACLSGGGPISYNFALPMQDIFQEISREFTNSGISFYNHMIMGGQDFSQKVTNDMSTLPNVLGMRTATHLEDNIFMYAGENRDAAFDFMQNKGFETYSWKNHNFSLFADFSDFDNFEAFGAQGYPIMSKNAFVLPMELMNTTATSGAASAPLQVLFAANGGGLTEEFTLVDAIRANTGQNGQGVSYFQNVATGRDYQNDHDMVNKFSSKTVMTAAFLGQEAMYMLQPA